MKLYDLISRRFFLPALSILMFPALLLGADFPLTLEDTAGNRVSFSSPPQQVVCLAPHIIEMVVRFGREQALAGLTRQDLIFHAGLRKPNVGGYFEPDIRAIEACRPDLIIAAPSHKEVIRHFADRRVIVMEAGTLEEAFAQMEMTGRLFDCEARAAEVIRDNREKLALVKARLAALPAREKKRVVRVMAGDELSCPGDDSFQNEIIEAAGGTVPKWGKTGFAVPVDLKDWQDFNPQVVYGCHTNEKAVRDLLGRDGWKDADAVRTGAVAMFPCELTCRVSPRTGDFVQWLAAVLYPDLFADPKTAASENRVLDQKPVLLDLPYVDRAGVVQHRVADAEYKSMAVRFKTPQNVLSTFEGSRSGIKAVGNTYVPMHASLGHMAKGVDQVKTAIAKNLGYEADEYAGLMTGADMDNLSVQKQTFKDLEVRALVTAGVRGNALRLSRDSGGYTKPGTINIMVLSNRRLSPGAMAWALVTITEAKTAALSDLDIRSTYTPWDHRATGTGTDTIIVVQGEGPEANYTGGHTKIGELIAKAVHAGVTEAVSLQNGIRGDRDLFQKLAERKLSLEQVLELFPVETGKKPPVSWLEDVLMTPYYASFLESALAVSDEYQKGLVRDLAFFDDMCASVTARLAGKTGIPPRESVSAGLPLVMAKAFGALVAGITEQQN